MLWASQRKARSGVCRGLIRARPESSLRAKELSAASIDQGWAQQCRRGVVGDAAREARTFDLVIGAPYGKGCDHVVAVARAMICQQRAQLWSGGWRGRRSSVFLGQVFVSGLDNSRAGSASSKSQDVGSSSIQFWRRAISAQDQQEFGGWSSRRVFMPEPRRRFPRWSEAWPSLASLLGAGGAAHRCRASRPKPPRWWRGHGLAVVGQLMAVDPSR